MTMQLPDTPPPPPPPRKAEKPERKPVWRRPAIRIMKIERTESGTISFPCSKETPPYQPYYIPCES